MDTFHFGHSPAGLPIFGNRFGKQGPKVLVLGGVHGNEPEGVICALGLSQRCLESFTLKVDLTIVPIFNPEGVFAGSRKNGRGVDLNRNLPTKDWTSNVAEEKYFPGPEACSEPENKALVEWINTNKPKFIVSLHSWKPCLNVNGDCIPEAEIMKKITGYEITKDIGYPTPGCLGTYTGLERDIPTITYEIERGLDNKSVIDIHVKSVFESLKSVEKRFN